MKVSLHNTIAKYKYVYYIYVTLISVYHTFLRKGYGPEDIAITAWYLDRLKEVPDLYLCSYYFSYFAFNVNKHVQTIYLLLWIYFDVNYIYLQILTVYSSMCIT